MKKIVLFSSLAIILIVIGVTYAQKNSTYKVNLSYGNVQVSHNNGQKWITAEPEMELVEMDTVKTGNDSYCDILMPGRGNFRIVEDTMVTMNKLRKQLEQIKIKSGKVLFNITQKLKNDETFKVESEVAVAAVRGTEFVIETDGGKLKCSVIHGTVAIRRNVKIPVEDQTGELAGKLEVDATANQEIEMTMDENKALEDLLFRAKNDMAELKSILSDSHDQTQKKVHLIKNADRLLKELNKADETQNNNGEESSEDDTSDILNKAKKNSR